MKRKIHFKDGSSIEVDQELVDKLMENIKEWNIFKDKNEIIFLVIHSTEILYIA